MGLSGIRRKMAIAILALGCGTGTWAAVVRGEVRDAEGTTVPEAVVVLDPKDGSGTRVATAATRAGAFLFAAVRPATYEIKVETPGLVIDSARATAQASGVQGPVTVWEGRPTRDRPLVVEVSDGTAIEIQITVGKGVVLGTGETRSVDAVLDDAVRRIQQGACAEAIGALEGLIAVAPDVPKAHYLVGFCRGAGGQVDDALRALDRTLDLRPGYPGAAMLKGQILAQSGRHEPAQAAFRAEIESTTSDAMAREAWWGLGLSLRDSGNASQALEAFSRAAEAGSGKPEAWIEVAEIHRKSGELDQAEAALGRAAERGIPVARAMLNLGVARLGEKQFQRAARIFEAVGSSEGKDDADRALAYGLLGKARLAEGDRARARDAFRKSLDLDPAGELAEEARAHLGDLGG